jgi:thermitase
MNRQNFLGHIALALAIIMVAAFLGQMRRWEREGFFKSDEDAAGKLVKVDEPPPAANTEDADEADDENASEVIVRFRPNVTEEQIDALTAQLNDEVEDEIESVKGLTVIEDHDGLSAEEAAARYREHADLVEYAEPVMQIQLDPSETKTSSSQLPTRILGAPNDPQFGEQWALHNTGANDGKQGADISALRAWEKTHGSERVVVAVLDSGVDYTHPDLINNIWHRPANVPEYNDAELGAVNDEHGFNAAAFSDDEDDADNPMDENGHGTHCAGIIGAEGDNNLGIAGVNWHVQIMPLKFMNRNGFGTTKAAIEAINYVIDRKKAGVNVRVISASWGSTQKSKALEDAIKRAGDEGILFVAAAGNNSSNNDRAPHYPSSYNLPNVISVAALNRRDELASFSNFGAKSVHIAAPGAQILSTWLGGDFEEHSGTSMAAPMVSGVAALVLSVEPDVTVEQLRARLLESADKLPTLQGKVACGGRLNAARAVGVH